MASVDRRDVIAFIDLAFDRMLAKAEALGERVGDRPNLDGSNSVFALVVHCIGVTEWWLGHAILGRTTHRDRDAEFAASGTVADLRELVDQFRSTLPELVEHAVNTPAPASTYLEAKTADHRVWPWTTASICLHVVEELFQHAGHVDITADLLTEDN